MKQITPFLWFDNNAKDAADFYTSIFPDSKILNTSFYQTDTPSGLPKGAVMTVNFEINNQEFTALNGGPVFKFNESISFVIKCKNQSEIDYYWEKLSSVKEAERCGWAKDKFGISWQIIPENLGELISSEKSMKAMLSMKKIVIKDLQDTK